jgi:methyl-accepting chemotaxis protein
MPSLFNQKTVIMNDNGNVFYKAMLDLEEDNRNRKLISLISSIAQNTHILSLNAAVESARAGNAEKDLLSSR